MSTIKRFEEIEAWQLARELACQVYRVTKNGTFSHDYGLKDQIQRASVSIMSNIAEGFERSGTKEFINFLSIAKGSCGEVRSQVYIAYDLEYVNENEFKSLLTKCVATSIKLHSFIQSLKNSDFKGTKYKEV